MLPPKDRPKNSFMRLGEHGYRLRRWNDHRRPAHRPFEQCLSIEQRTELLRQVISKDLPREGTESDSFSSGKDYGGIIGYLGSRGGGEC